MPDVTERACPVCGDAFMPHRQHTQNGGRGQIYCSAACGSRAGVRRLPERGCEECGRRFRPKDRRGRFCSGTCQGRARERRRPPRPGRGERVTRSCEWCGDPFTSLKSNRARFCSLRCAGEAQSLRSCAVPWAECLWCGHWFVKRYGRRFCSQRCTDANHPYRRKATVIVFGDCRRCGRTFVRRASQLGEFCSTRCHRKADKNHRRHLQRASSGGEMFTVRDIADRDGWRCHLCGRKVPDLPCSGHPLEPTIDHLVPVNRKDGGTHTRANVALAHRKCNTDRGTGGEVQLRLVG